MEIRLVEVELFRADGLTYIHTYIHTYVREAVKKFPEMWYTNVMVGNMATLT